MFKSRSLCIYCIAFMLGFTTLSFAQKDNTFMDEAFFYSIKFPGDWEINDKKAMNSIVRMTANSANDTCGFTAIAFKSDQGKIFLPRLVEVLETEPEIKKILGNSISRENLERYKMDIIEKHYIKEGFFENSYKTIDYIAKDNYAIVFIYESTREDRFWQEPIKSSISFNFPLSREAKAWRFTLLVGGLVFLGFGINASSEPFGRSKSFGRGLTSIVLLFRALGKNQKIKKTIQEKSLLLENKTLELRAIENKVQPKLDQYWLSIKDYIKVS